MGARARRAARERTIGELWKELAGLLVGVAMVVLLYTAYAFDVLSFHASPRIFTMIVLMGAGGYVFAVTRIGKLIVGMRALHMLARAERSEITGRGGGRGAGGPGGR